MVKRKIPFAYDENYDSWILLNFNYNGEKLPIGANYNGEIGMVEFESIYTMIKFAIGK